MALGLFTALSLISVAQASKTVVGYLAADVPFLGDGGSAPGQFTFLDDVAVNGSGAGTGANPGDFYATDGSSVGNRSSAGRVQQFDKSGDFIRQWGWDVVRTGPDDTGADEQQTITVPGTVTAGGYTLDVIFGVANDPCGSCSSGPSNTIERINVDGTLQIGSQIRSTNNSPPAGTTITDWNPETTVLTLSSAVGNPQNYLQAFETTQQIAWDAPASGPGSVQEALEDLPGIGPGNVSVGSSTDASGTTYTVTFDGGDLANDDLVPMVANSAGLTGGSATIDTVTNGGGFEICDQPGDPYEECKWAVGPETPGPGPGAGGVISGGDLVVEPSTGNVLVSGGDNRLSIFSASGEFQGALGWDVAGSGDPGNTGTGLEYCTTGCKAGISDPEGGSFGPLAVHTGTGHLYTSTFRRVDEYALAHNPAGEVTDGVFQRAFGLDTVASGPDDTGTGFEVCNQVDNPTDVCKQGEGGSTVGALGGMTDLAVNSTGVVYTVQDGNFGIGVSRVQAFTPDQATPPYTSYTPTVFAPGLLSSNAFGGQLRANAVAVDPADRVFVSKEEPAGNATCSDGSASHEEDHIYELDSAGTLLETHMICRDLHTENPGFSLDAVTGDLLLASVQDLEPGQSLPDTRRGVFIVSESDPATASIVHVTPNTAGATVEGTFNPNGPAPGFPNSSTASYQIEYKRTVDSSWSTFGLPVDAGFGFSDKDVTIFLGGLQSNTGYDIRIAGLKEGVTTGYSAVETFTTLPTPPSVQGLSSSEVTASSANLNASIHPHGSPTSYYFEYGKTPEYGQTTPVVEIGDALTAQSVQQRIENLDPVVYHFRVVATNEQGTFRSRNQTFNFFPEPCPNEAVRQQNASSYLPDCRAYELVSPEDAGNVVLLTTSAISLAPPYATSPARIAFGGRFGAVTGTNPILSTLDTYVATRTNTGWETTFPGIQGDQALGSAWGGGDLSLDSLFYWKDPVALSNVPQPLDNIPYIFNPDGDLVGRWPGTAVPGSNETAGQFQPSPDYSHMAFSSVNVDFDPEGGGLTSAPGSAYDYNVETGTTTLISETAAGIDIPQESGNTFNSDEYIQFPAVRPGRPLLPARINPGVSTDGSHILMSTASSPAIGAPVRLYMRVDNAVTYDIAGPHYVNYVGMTTDGSRVFFTSKEDLTPDSSDNDTSTDLYMWKEADDEITRLSVGVGGAGNTDECNAGWTEDCGVGTVVGSGGGDTDYPIATTAGDVYFYSPELLDGPANGMAGSQNLYVYRHGAVQFVASLAADGSGPITRMQVATDGAHAAFISTSRLTTYDNAGFAEMYAFDAGRREITCVSCVPSGDPPTGDVAGSTVGLFMANDGRTFFTTSDALVQRDTNEGADVYEFVDGRPQLLTPGTGATRENAVTLQVQPTTLTGVSADGVNAYFGTYETLVENDQNGDVFKFYVARTGGGFPVSVERQPCAAADECHSGSSAEPDAPPIASSAALGVGGNVGAFSRCGPLARRAKRKSMSAKRMQRRAVRLRRTARGRRTRALQRRARHFSKGARRQSRRAKRCRRASRRTIK